MASRYARAILLALSNTGVCAISYFGGRFDRSRVVIVRDSRQAVRVVCFLGSVVHWDREAREVADHLSVFLISAPVG